MPFHGCKVADERINQLKDLSLLLDTASIVLPLIVTVSGKVSSDRPIKCEASGLECVILKEMTEKRIMKREMNNAVGFTGNDEELCSWKEEHNEIEFVTKEVPWYLDDGSGQVFVVAAQRASYWESTIIGHDRGYKSQCLPMTGTLDKSRGEMDLVVKTSKPVLLTGTPLTVVGEAVKDEIGTIRIQQPKAGPFYVSRMNIDKLIDHLEEGARVLDAATETPQPNDEESVAEAGNGLGVTELIPVLCVICLQQEYNSALIPCGHMCCCVNCSSQLTECPLCRRRINQVVRVFRG